MPEIAEIETVRQRLEKALRGKSITEVHAEENDRFLFAQTPLAAVKKALLGARVIGSGRKGKYFWLELNRRPWPLFHFGMTGNIEIRRPGEARRHGWGGVKLWREGERKDGNHDEERTWFSRLQISTEDGTEVAFTDPRRFGRIWLCEAPLLHPRVQKLGYDPLLDFPSSKELRLLLRKRKAPIKAVLLDQKLFAGVGNWVADEILYQAKLSPKRLANSLAPAEVARLRVKTIAVVKKAVAVEADYESFPDTWLFHHRWGKNAKALTLKKEKIRHDEIGGRTTAWVPAVQK